MVLEPRSSAKFHLDRLLLCGENYIRVREGAVVVGKKKNRKISNFICFHLLDHWPLSMASGPRMMSCEATVVDMSFRRIIAFLDQKFKSIKTHV